MSKYIDLDNVEFLKVDGNKEFNHGVDCCINKLLKQERVRAIPLDKVKKARDKIHDVHMKMLDKYRMSNLLIALEILDKLIESEENND